MRRRCRYFFTSVAFLPLLSAANRPGYTPCVINISSISGITRTTQHHFNYNVSKAATIQLNNLLAQEFSQPGVQVRVNSIAPGIFPSQMTSECYLHKRPPMKFQHCHCSVAEGKDERNKSQIEAGEDYGDKKGIPAGRPGAETDMAQTALHIACNQYLYGQVSASLWSPSRLRGSPYVQTIAVDGGYLLKHP